jgi:hypothetical protein
MPVEFAKRRQTGRTQRMLEEAAAFQGNVVVYAHNERYAKQLCDRMEGILASLGKSSIRTDRTILSGGRRIQFLSAQGRPIGATRHLAPGTGVFTDHYVWERET